MSAQRERTSARLDGERGALRDAECRSHGHLEDLAGHRHHAVAVADLERAGAADFDGDRLLTGGNHEVAHFDDIAVGRGGERRSRRQAGLDRLERTLGLVRREREVVQRGLWQQPPAVGGGSGAPGGRRAGQRDQRRASTRALTCPKAFRAHREPHNGGGRDSSFFATREAQKGSLATRARVNCLGGVPDIGWRGGIRVRSLRRLGWARWGGPGRAVWSARGYWLLSRDLRAVVGRTRLSPIPDGGVTAWRRGRRWCWRWRPDVVRVR